MSPPSPDHPFVHIAQRIAPRSQLLGHWSLRGGLSAEMTALEMRDPAGQTQKLVVRQRPRHAPQAVAAEFKLLQRLRAAGLPVPAPYALDCSRTLLPAPYMVLGYIEGEMLFTPTRLDRHVQQLARQLAAIHRVAEPLPFLPQHPTPCPERGATRPPWADPHLDEAAVQARLAAWGTPPPPSTPTLLHGDFWPGNSLWRAGQLVAVIDWEDAQRGDPLLDLARSRLEIAWIFGREALAQFTQQYRALMPLDYTHLPYWDLCAVLRFMRLAGSQLAAWAAFFAPFGRPDITPQTITAAVRSFVTPALELLGERP